MRCSKLVTTIVSTFTANYVLGWSKYFPDAPLTAPLPSFDGRAVCYPSNTNLRDYLSWRQADCKLSTTGSRLTMHMLYPTPSCTPRQAYRVLN